MGASSSRAGGDRQAVASARAGGEDRSGPADSVRSPSPNVVWGIALAGCAATAVATAFEWSNAPLVYTVGSAFDLVPAAI
jgi:hypothetical protein